MFQSPEKRLFHSYEDLQEWFKKTVINDGDRILMKVFKSFDKAYKYWVS